MYLGEGRGANRGTRRTNSSVKGGAKERGWAKGGKGGGKANRGNCRLAAGKIKQTAKKSFRFDQVPATGP